MARTLWVEELKDFVELAEHGFRGLGFRGLGFRVWSTIL